VTVNEQPFTSQIYWYWDIIENVVFMFERKTTAH